MMTILSNPLITVAPGDILVEMLSWLSFVQRWPVLIQLMLVLIVLLIMGLVFEALSMVLIMTPVLLPAAMAAARRR